MLRGSGRDDVSFWQWMKEGTTEAVSLPEKANGRNLAGDGRIVGRGLRELRIHGECLSGTALAGDEDADAFDHLSGRASALGQKGIGGTGAVEGVDGAGDDHRRKAGMKLLGATDELIAVHLRHKKIAKEKIERPWCGLLNNIERLLRGGCSDDSVAAGFEQEGADREDLFVIVDTENRLLRAHAVSHSAGRHG